MLDAYIIGEINGEEEEKRRQRENRIPLQPPLEEPPKENEEGERDRGVIIIESKECYQIIDSYQ